MVFVFDIENFYFKGESMTFLGKSTKKKGPAFLLSNFSFPCLPGPWGIPFRYFGRVNIYFTNF